VDGTDVHFSEAGYFAECIAATDVDPVLELGCRLVRESEGDDIRRYTAAPALLYRGQQGHNPSRNNLGFAGAGARDNLKVALDVVDCSLLGVSKLHMPSSAFSQNVTGCELGKQVAATRAKISWTAAQDF
jgi:hypothetical protein